jgi:hypothetical protein
VTGGVTASLHGTASWAENAVSASITYVSEIGNQNLNEIEIADFDANVAVTYTGGRLKFVFGTPTTQSITSFSFNNTFLTDRFNQVFDAYTASAIWSNGAYNLISASIFEGSTLLANTGTGTTLNFNTNTTGSHTYTLHVTASSPLDNSIVVKTQNLVGNLTKVNPGNPTLNITSTDVQLGVGPAPGNAIEQGATGSISFTSASGASNGWVEVFTSTNVASPVAIPAGGTGLTITATSHYSSSGVNGSDNDPARTTTTTTSIGYTKIRSIRGGASAQPSFTQVQLEDLSAWDVSLGGTIGTINKGVTGPGTVTFSYTGNKYLYVVCDASMPNLAGISIGATNLIGQFSLSVVGQYKVYRTNVLNAGGTGTSQTYTLTI